MSENNENNSIQPATIKNNILETEITAKGCFVGCGILFLSMCVLSLIMGILGAIYEEFSVSEETAATNISYDTSAPLGTENNPIRVTAEQLYKETSENKARAISQYGGLNELHDPKIIEVSGKFASTDVRGEDIFVYLQDGGHSRSHISCSFRWRHLSYNPETKEKILNLKTGDKVIVLGVYTTRDIINDVQILCTKLVVP